MIYADILFFAIVAAFIALKLRSSLGRKDGTEDRLKERMQRMQQEIAEQMQQAETQSKPQTDAKTVDSQAIEIPLKDASIAKKLDDIGAKDASFNAATFIKGAQTAFDMVVKAFNEQDKEVLKHLLSENVYKEFEKEITRLEKKKQRLETTIISIAEPVILSASLRGKTAQIEVEFVTEQVNIIRDAHGKIVDGDAGDVSEVREDWVFEREIGSSSPAWLVVAT